MGGHLRFVVFISLAALWAGCDANRQSAEPPAEAVSAAIPAPIVTPASAETSPREETRPVTLEAAIETAKSTLKELGYKVEEMIVRADDENSRWNSYSGSRAAVLETENVKRMALETKDYWAIHLGSGGRKRGGDAWVFVDRGSGEVIGLIRGR